MKDEAARYIHESKITVERIERDFTNTGSMTAADAGDLFRFGFEFPLKAIVTQKYGTVPTQYRIHPLASLANSIGLTSYLPSDVRSGMAEIKGWHMAYPDQAVFDKLVQSSTPADWRLAIDAAKSTREFVVNEVLSDSSSIYPKLFQVP